MVEHCECENAKIAKNIAKAHETTEPAALKRYDETGDHPDELIWQTVKTISLRDMSNRLYIKLLF